MPGDTLWPTVQNVVKYTLILAGGRMLYINTLGAAGPDSAVDSRLVRPLREQWLGPGWLKVAAGLAILAGLHCLLRVLVQHRQREQFFRAAARRTDRGSARDAADSSAAGAAVLTGAGGGRAGRIVLLGARELPKIVLGAAGAVLLMKGSGVLDHLYFGCASWLSGLLAGEQAHFLFSGSFFAHAIKAVVGIALVETGYLWLARGMRREHGVLLRLVRIEDRRVERLHLDAMKIRGFGLQMQTRDTEGIIADTTPTADVKVRIYTAQGVKHGIDYLLTYLKNLEPTQRQRLPLHVEDIALVKEGLRTLRGEGPIPSLSLKDMDVEALRKFLVEKSGGVFRDDDMARILVAMERADAANVLDCQDSALLEAVNDCEVGFEGGMFSRSMFKRDEAGHLTPVATMIEDLTLMDQVSSSPRNGYGPNYWRRGRLLMGFRFYRGTAEDGTAMRTVIHEIIKSRLRRYWDFGDSYLWNFKDHTFFIDNSWFASYGWLIPGRWIPRRRYVVRDARSRVAAVMEERFIQKLLLDMDWNIRIYDETLNNEDAVLVLSLLTEFLHDRRKYTRARMAPGNTPHERLLVAGGRKRSGQDDSLVGGV